ncbi:MAG: 30S ribosomal protein S12 methylthiotransferase RimO [Muribaculaceae bacterium]
MKRQTKHTPRPGTLDVITMGCSKNLVDSERLMRMFADAGFEVRHNPETPDAAQVVINTCGFIGDAKQESIDMILECLEAKKAGRIGQLSVMGCLAERYRRELPAELPEVDRWYGKFDWTALLQDVTCKGGDGKASPWERQLTTGPHFAYVKIAEGCDRFCGFCAIPLITGRMHSRPIEEIADEVRSLVEGGTHEFNIIAQDLSSYGKDIYGHKALAELVQTLADIPGVEWLRLHYAYPSDFPYDILPVMARNANVCKYLDIALQHVSDNVLSNMRRHITGDETRQLLDRIRREVPGIHIRTTLMTGYPGEGEKEFGELMDFVREQRFERMGAFAYCEEEDTYAARNLRDEVPQEVKEERLDRLMELQEQISLELQEQKIGRTLRVVCDSEDEEFYVCRSEFDSPEVDPEILVPKAGAPCPLERGKFYDVTVREAYPFELIAEIAQDR